MNTEKIRELLALCEITENDEVMYRLDAKDPHNHAINVAECLSHKINHVKEGLASLLTPEAAEGELVGRLQEAVDWLRKTEEGMASPPTDDTIADDIEEAIAALTKEPAKLLETWSDYRPEPADIQPEDLQPMVEKWCENNGYRLVPDVPESTENRMLTPIEPSPDSPVEVGEVDHGDPPLGKFIADLRGACHNLRVTCASARKQMVYSTEPSIWREAEELTHRTEDALHHLRDTRRKAISLTQQVESLTKQIEGHEGAWDEMASGFSLTESGDTLTATNPHWKAIGTMYNPLAFQKIKDAITRLQAKGEPPVKQGEEKL